MRPRSRQASGEAKMMEVAPVCRVFVASAHGWLWAARPELALAVWKLIHRGNVKNTILKGAVEQTRTHGGLATNWQWIKWTKRERTAMNVRLSVWFFGVVQDRLVAHNGLVGGSNPSGPTRPSAIFAVFLRTCEKTPQWRGSVGPPSLSIADALLRCHRQVVLCGCPLATSPVFALDLRVLTHSYRWRPFVATDNGVSGYLEHQALMRRTSAANGLPRNHPRYKEGLWPDESRPIAGRSPDGDRCLLRGCPGISSTARERLTPSRWTNLGSVRSLIFAGGNWLSGSRSASLGRKRSSQVENSVATRVRDMDKASINAGERKSSPSGSHAGQLASFPNQERHFCRNTSASGSSLQTPAYSNPSANANALLLRVPARTG